MSACDGTTIEAKDELFAFAESGGQLLAQVEADDECAREHPLLVHLTRWLVQSEAVHRVNLQDGTASGLLAHLSEAWCWTTDRSGMCNEFRAALGTPGSSIDLGRLVDAEVAALILGASLAQPPHAYTRMLLAFLRERNWLPLATQVPLWHRSNTIYTFVDLLVYDAAQKQLVLVELKTGFDHAYDTPISNAEREMDVFVDSHHMRHQQQLCWMQVVLEAEFASLLPKEQQQQPLRGCIVRVSNAVGVREPDWSDDAVRDYFSQIYIRNDAAYASN